MSNKSKKQKLLQAAVILIPLLYPFLQYILFEYVTGNLLSVKPLMAMMNVLWIASLFALLFVLSGTARFAVTASSVFFFALSLAETYVMEFRSRPIMIWDVLSIPTAISVAGNYQYHISKEMVISFLILTVYNLAAWRFPARLRSRKQRVAAILGGCGAAAGFASVFFLWILPGMNLTVNMWNVNETFQEYGYILSSMVSCQYLVTKPPAGYSQARVKEIYEKTLADMDASSSDTDEEASAIRPVNLICIMNESFSELKIAGDFTTNEDYLPFFNNMEDNVIKGSLFVPVFGSMTANTEYEFLTGDSTSMIPYGVIPFQTYVYPNTLSLVSTLKSQGYRATAMHPAPASNWNRHDCYRNLGFDEFIDINGYEDSDMLRNYVSDLGDYKKIIEYVEGKDDPKEPLFIFNVTIQNHGGYEGEYDNFEPSICLTGDCAGKYPKADQYLSLMKESDDALRFLIDYFSDFEEPTMIVLFGDHQPSVEDEFYDQIAGKPSTEATKEERLMWYQTPFIIWTNYAQPSRYVKRLSAEYLSSLVLSAANLQLTPYQQYLLTLSETLPVIHPFGLYDSTGLYFDWKTAESESFLYHDLIFDFEYATYNHSLDHKELTEFYQVPANPPPASR